MKGFQHLKSFKNQIDFILRNTLHWSVPLKQNQSTHLLASRQQFEILEFLELFDWKTLLASFPKEIVAADVGARTFSFGPAFEDLFEKFGLQAEITGIEIDPFRRFTNFHTRSDYGHYYAGQMEKGFYFEGDFLKWEKQCHVIFLLNPFVTREPLLTWGLPLNQFKPTEIFKHAKKLLEKQKGVLIVSSPSSEEYLQSLKIAEQVGFQFLESKNWYVYPQSIQRQPRFGMALKA